MTDYVIRIIVNGEDRASAPLRNAGGALGNMAQIAGGILGAGLFTKIAGGIQGMFMSSIGATEQMQNMAVGMEGLIARELAQADAAKMAAEGMQLTGEMAKTIDDYLPQAGENAKKLMDELERLSVVSPYQVETIQSTFRTAMAFGYTTEEAKKYTEALLNVAAGTGANNEMLGRMSYNFAQIRMQGRVTAVDIRQLAMAGFDLNGVLRSVGDQFGVTIKDHNDFNDAIASGKITWEQFTQGFAKYAEDNFGGAAERMARTLTGLKSTFKDVFTLTMPKVLGPAVEKFTGFAGRFLDSLLKIRESGLLEEAGVKIGELMDKGLQKAEPFLQAFDTFFTVLANGQSPMMAFELALGKILGVDTVGEALQLKAVLDGITNTFAFMYNIVKMFVTGDFEGGFWRKLGIQEDDPLIMGVFMLRDLFLAIGNWVMEHIAPFVSFKDVFISLGIILAATVLPVLGSLIASLVAVAAPILLLIGLVALARNAWQGNWFGIRDVLTKVWQETLQPALQDLMEWLSVNLPIGLQKLSDFWSNVLQPALKKVWEFLTVTLMPIWKALGDLLKSFYELWLVNLKNQFTALVAVWNTVLKPALDKLFEWLGTAVDWFGKVTGGVNGIAGAIRDVAGWFDTLKGKISNLKLPDWLTPGSPTPLELGIKGITGALMQLNRTALADFSGGLSGLGGAGGPAAGGNNVTIGQVNITAQPGQDGAALYRQFKGELERDLRSQRNTGLGLSRL